MAGVSSQTCVSWVQPMQANLLTRPDARRWNTQLARGAFHEKTHTAWVSGRGVDVRKQFKVKSHIQTETQCVWVQLKLFTPRHRATRFSRTTVD